VKGTSSDFYTEYFNEFVVSFIALVASGRATEGPGGIRTHGRSPTFTANWVAGVFWDRHC
jgi:hypothetical protein